MKRSGEKIVDHQPDRVAMANGDWSMGWSGGGDVLRSDAVQGNSEPERRW